ncbi:hypothetical protein DB35_00105 [Streptomyces abyssalis]|uniref:Uncharacterized protein n=1 Tax=Streptomyces abyssalis TaxID=933944 RepID=A0A1E7JQC3_9ACTN|nr:hypothetical protein [Streptomyces abyssalis]OEV28862.1 hypothetical protein AN219_19730 [Streptomyces nanshensis]OEU90456.1 hypothetical protein AN215_13480 [Streptomyces abyssalis]OEU95193.1 hypothetical protein DB35_04385 [Streptomyces abyssalis]OEU95930.1 hypothetical protein AN215_00120 [Streptomyces abyssalis]OEU96028.1 hypothetical protein DB35_00105 [Streptomyces abyssalis]
MSTRNPTTAFVMLTSVCVLLSLVVKEAAAVLWGAGSLFLVCAVVAAVRHRNRTEETAGSRS